MSENYSKFDDAVHFLSLPPDFTILLSLENIV
jgi:hypothetical protein